jgi:hypothetical protein
LEVLNLDAGLSCLDIAEKVMKVTELESNFENFVGGRVAVEMPYDRIQQYFASSIHRRFTMGQYVGHVFMVKMK